MPQTKPKHTTREDAHLTGEQPHSPSPMNTTFAECWERMDNSGNVSIRCTGPWDDIKSARTARNKEFPWTSFAIKTTVAATGLSAPLWRNNLTAHLARVALDESVLRPKDLSGFDRIIANYPEGEKLPLHLRLYRDGWKPAREGFPETILNHISGASRAEEKLTEIFNPHYLEELKKTGANPPLIEGESTIETISRFLVHSSMRPGPNERAIDNAIEASKDAALKVGIGSGWIEQFAVKRKFGILDASKFYTRLRMDEIAMNAKQTITSETLGKAVTGGGWLKAGATLGVTWGANHALDRTLPHWGFGMTLSETPLEICAALSKAPLKSKAQMYSAGWFLGREMNTGPLGSLAWLAGAEGTTALLTMNNPKLLAAGLAGNALLWAVSRIARNLPGPSLTETYQEGAKFYRQAEQTCKKVQKMYQNMNINLDQ